MNLLLEQLQEYSNLFLLKKTPTYKRFLLEKLNLKNRILGILGAKGVGKTTLLLQFMKECGIDREEMIYISVDHPLMSSTTILEIAKSFQENGGKLLVLDEIHYQDNFNQDLKTIWDFLDICVIFSGSSAMHLDRADLSRRVLKYTLPSLSFREFLEIETGLEFNSYELEEIIYNHSQIAFEIAENIKPLKYFKKYLTYGFYPFYLEDIDSYKLKVLEAINKTIDIDLLKIYNIEPKKLRNIKKILTLLCKSLPYKPNMTSLANASEIDIKTLYTYLNALESAKIIRMIPLASRGEGIIKKPEKIYLDNPSLFDALCKNPHIGTIRESFFSNIVQNSNHTLVASKQGDFIVDEKYLFEIGGKGKSYKQIKDIENSFVVADDIEIGNKNKIPLWLFGFLY